MKKIKIEKIESLITRIRNILDTEPGPIWLRKLARKLNMNPGLLHYYLIGKDVDGRIYGGYFRNDIKVVREFGHGNLKIIKIRK